MPINGLTQCEHAAKVLHYNVPISIEHCNLMHSPRVYFNNIGSKCTESLRHGNGLSALLLIINTRGKK